MPIGRITQLHVQRWVNYMTADAGYRPSYILSAYTLLSGILRGAAAAKLIREAPLLGIELPSPERKEERFLNEAEIDLLVAQFEPFYRPLIFTAAWTGLRWGELAGLSQARLDLEARQLEVRDVLSSSTEDGHMRWKVKPYPKSDAGRRRIGLASTVVDVLRNHLDGTESELVFTTPKGKLLTTSNFTDKDRGPWRPALDSFLSNLPACRQNELRGMTFHDLRHTHTALLIKYGWPEFQIVRRLGWKDSKMLHRTYGHLFPNHDDALILDLERRLQEVRSRPDLSVERARMQVRKELGQRI